MRRSSCCWQPGLLRRTPPAACTCTGCSLMQLEAALVEVALAAPRWPHPPARAPPPASSSSCCPRREPHQVVPASYSLPSSSSGMQQQEPCRRRRWRRRMQVEAWRGGLGAHRPTLCPATARQHLRRLQGRITLPQLLQAGGSSSSCSTAAPRLGGTATAVLKLGGVAAVSTLLAMM